MRAGRPYRPRCRTVALLVAGAIGLTSGVPFSAASGTVSSAVSAGAAATSAGNLGLIDFPNSGARAAQEPFVRGVLLLHSFEYGDAAEAFRQAQTIDPGFALAYWGEAMTHHHPIWQEENVAAARDALGKLATTPAERRAKAGTEREKGLLDCVEILYGEGSRKDQRLAYSRAMGLLHDRYPEDLEVASFYALSILGTSFGVRDVPTYMRAAAVAEEVYAKNPQHPGAIHYLIHAYDDPVHAPLGLRVARAYGRVAPAASHALHMPSHIYFALGMWDDSAASNEASIAAADARVARKGLGVENRGLHALYWLAYTYLQEGRIDAARTLLTQMRKDAESSGSMRVRFHYAAMKAAQAVVTGEGTARSASAMPVETADLVLPISAGDHLVEGLAAARAGDLDAARALLKTMREQSDRVSEAEAEAVHAGCAPGVSPYTATDPPGRQAALVMAEELAGVIRLKEGRPEEAVKTLRHAAEMEDGMGFDFGPPAVVKPANELLGETLLEMGRSREAQAAFAAALTRAPGRSLSLAGLARAAAASGDAAAASATYAELAANLHAADPGYPLLAEATRGGPARH
jgi:tetratricopeptide (TPR) repeat protein